MSPAKLRFWPRIQNSLALLLSLSAFTACQEGQLVPIELHGKVSTPEGEITRGFQGSLCALPYINMKKPVDVKHIKCATIVTNHHGEYQINMEYEVHRLYQDGTLPKYVAISFQIPGIINERLDFIETQRFEKDGKIDMRYDFKNPYGYAWGKQEDFADTMIATSRQKDSSAWEFLYEYGLEHITALNPVEITELASKIEKIRSDYEKSDELLLRYVRIMSKRGLLKAKEIELLGRAANSFQTSKLIKDMGKDANTLIKR
jgi:hypothetical protein